MRIYSAMITGILTWILVAIFLWSFTLLSIFDIIFICVLSYLMAVGITLLVTSKERKYKKRGKHHV